MQESRVIIVDESKSFLAGVTAILGEHCRNVSVYDTPELALKSLGEILPEVLIGNMNFLVQVKKTEELKDIPFILIANPADLNPENNASALQADSIQSMVNVKQCLITELKTMIELGRLRKVFKQSNQMGAIAESIRTCKHEFGNALGILDAKIYKFEKVMPEIIHIESYSQIKASVERLETILKKASQLAEDTESY